MAAHVPPADVEDVDDHAKSRKLFEEQEAAEYMIQWKNGFLQRKKAFLSANINAEGKVAWKHTFISHALKTGVVDEGVLNDMIRRVVEREKDVDFFIISLVRLLYVMHHSEVKPSAASQIKLDQLASALLNFPYWPSRDWHEMENNHLCFWSENHIVMTLGSAHLMRQWRRRQTHSKTRHGSNTNASGGAASPGAADGAAASPMHAGGAEVGATSSVLADMGDSLEEALLLSYLTAHAATEMMFEVLSHVYIPYTVSALMNLVDFSENEQIREAANKWLCVAVKHVLLGTTDSGVVTLTASARGFARTRTDCTGHNINNLVYLLSGAGVDASPEPSQVTDFLLTTSWVPTAKVMSFHMLQGRLTVRASPTLESIRTMFADVPENERVPFYWSAGLLLHPNFTRETKEYQHRKRLGKNDTLFFLKWVPGIAARGLVHAYGPFSRGQTYCGLTLNIYKRHGGLCLSSFERYNQGNVSFQQLPWCANIGGASVWTQTGDGNMKSAFTNTHNPCIRQRGPICTIEHNVPKGMSRGPITGMILKYTARLYWPVHKFDQGTSRVYTRYTNDKMQQSWLQFAEAHQDSTVPCWRIARRGVCFIGVYCSHATIAEIDPMLVDSIASTATEHIAIACHARKHTWVVVVGTVDEYLDYDVKPMRSSSTAGKSKDGTDTDKKAGALSKTLAAPESTASPTAVKLAPLDAFAQRCLSMRITQAGEAMGGGDVEVEDEVEGIVSGRTEEV